MLPRADEIIQYARDTADDAARRLEKSQARTRSGIIMVGIAMVALGLGFSWLIGRSITRPLNGLATVMKRLADGDTTARIPATHARDEIGEMARTVIVFRDNMIERERLAQTQTEASRAREQRSDVIAHTISQFKHSVESALSTLRTASMKLEMSSADLNKAADTVSSEADTAKSRVSRRVGKRHRGGKLGRGTGGIDRRNRVASRKINRRRRPCRFGSAAHRHDDEGAWQRRNPHRRSRRPDPGDRRADQPSRAERNNRGGAGRRIRQGFAVVAAEVKSLAGQTAKATEEIAEQIGAIQSAAADASQAIEQVDTIIRDMASIATTVAATVDQQNSAVASIAEGVSRASGEARVGADAMSRVAGVTADARATASGVKDLADSVAHEAEGLEAQVRQFLSDVQAA